MSTESSGPTSARVEIDSLQTEEGMQEVPNDAAASIQLSPDLWDQLEGCTNSRPFETDSSQRLSYSVFTNDVLFQPQNRSLYKVGSAIVAARIMCELRTNSSRAPIQTTFPDVRNSILICVLIYCSI